MSPTIAVVTDPLARRTALLIWPVTLWPAEDRRIWVRSRLGKGPEGHDNPAAGWCGRTAKKNEDGYGRYLSWLDHEGLLIEADAVSDRITPERVAAYVLNLKTHLSSVGVAVMVGGLTSATRALAPDTDWSWLSRRATRLKLRAKPSREKRHAIQHTLDLYRFGQSVMDTASHKPRLCRATGVGAAKQYQAGLIIALLAARPLRIRNFQAIIIGRTLRWEGERYWLTFTADETKTGSSIDEPLPDDLIPYLECFLRTWRPLLLRQAARYSGESTHRRLWVDVFGKPMGEGTLRDLIKYHTKKKFGTALWPHLFRDCLLTSVAIDQPDLMRTSATLLGHTSYKTGEKHYNQARMLDAGRRYGAAIHDLRESFLDAPDKRPDRSTR